MTGVTAGKTLCSSADPQAVALQLQLAARVFYVGKHVGYEETTLQVPLSGQAMAMSSPGAICGRSGSVNAPIIRYYTGCGRLSGCCCTWLLTTRTSSPQPAPPRRAAGGAPGEVAPAVVDVGFAVGPEPLAARRPSTATAGIGASGVVVRAHLRRAHWHTPTGRDAGSSKR